ncbi:MAG: glycoside hydrolase family 65 protein, partial [Balneolaceae bacterium]
MKAKFTSLFIFISVSILLILSPFQLSAQTTHDPAWTIIAEQIDPSDYFGITVANGMVGIVSSADPMRVSEIVLNGVFDYYGRGRVSNILKGFNFATLQLDVDGVRINRNNISNVVQRLDMRTAVFKSTFDFGDKAEVTYSLRSLRNLPFTSLIELEVTAKQDITIRPSSLIEAPDHLRNVRNFYSVIDRPHVKIPLLTSVAESPTGKHTLAASSSFLFDEHEQPNLIHEDWDHNMHLVQFTKELKRGETYKFSVVSSATTTQHFDDPHNEAERLTIFAALEGRDRLLNRHLLLWEKLWESDIIIEGNVDDQRDVRMMLYHLYSFAREGTSLSLSPMGLSGLGYNGHVFWDTEIWMYPPFLMLQPDIAKSIIEYRYERLEQAKMKAFSHGFDGAMYPWESDDVGQESTPVWALTGPFQHHITAVVGIGVWNYYRVSQDKTWLQEKGYPVLEAVADYWISRVEPGADGKYHINNVVAADEYAENVDNNAFTNGTAIRALEYATKAAEVLGLEPNPQWSEVAANIPILEFEDGITREHATYDGETIKQADVNLLTYPLNLVTDPVKMRRNLEYYEQRV